MGGARKRQKTGTAGKAGRRLPSAGELQVVWLIGDGAMAKGSSDLALFEQEDAGHLLGIFLDHADSILEHRALEPSMPDDGIEEVEIGIGARQGEGGKLIERRLRIADPFHIGHMVVVEVGLGSLRRSEMHKHGPHAPGFNLPPHLRNAVQSLRAKSA